MADADKTLLTLENLSQFKTNYDSMIGYTGTESLMTADEKTKLAGIAEGAEVNVLEGVQVGGVDLVITDKKVNIDLSEYAKLTDIVNGVTYKGQVTNYSDLASLTPDTGDIYQITTADADNDIEAGEFVIYNGSTWEDLGGTLSVDLSDYYTKTESEATFQTISGLDAAIAALGYVKSSDISGEIDLSAYLTIENAASTYATKDELASYVTSESLTTTLANYVTTENVTTLISTALDGNYYDLETYPLATESDITALFS